MSLSEEVARFLFPTLQPQKETSLSMDEFVSWLVSVSLLKALVTLKLDQKDIKLRQYISVAFSSWVHIAFRYIQFIATCESAVKVTCSHCYLCLMMMNFSFFLTHFIPVQAVLQLVGL